MLTRPEVRRVIKARMSIVGGLVLNVARSSAILAGSFKQPGGGVWQYSPTSVWPGGQVTVCWDWAGVTANSRPIPRTSGTRIFDTAEPLLKSQDPLGRIRSEERR